jgi:hypothetical protein
MTPAASIHVQSAVLSTSSVSLCDPPSPQGEGLRLGFLLMGSCHHQVTDEVSMTILFRRSLRKKCANITQIRQIRRRARRIRHLSVPAAR